MWLSLGKRCLKPSRFSLSLSTWALLHQVSLSRVGVRCTTHALPEFEGHPTLHILIELTQLTKSEAALYPPRP